MLYFIKMFVLTKAQGLQTAWKKKRRREEEEEEDYGL
jgi:hypothetical protein